MFTSRITRKECLLALALLTTPWTGLAARARSSVLPLDWTWGPLFGDESNNLRLSDKSWAFDLDDRGWTALRPLPYALRDATAAALDDSFVLIAGGVEQAAGADQTADHQPRIILSNRCLLYDAAADRFTFAASLRLAVAGHGLVRRELDVLAIAGEDSPYRTRTDLVQRAAVDACILAGSNPSKTTTLSKI